MYSLYDESSIKKNGIAIDELTEFQLFIRLYCTLFDFFLFSYFYHLSNYAKNSRQMIVSIFVFPSNYFDKRELPYLYI